MPAIVRCAPAARGGEVAAGLEERVLVCVAVDADPSRGRVGAPPARGDLGRGDNKGASNGVERLAGGRRLDHRAGPVGAVFGVRRVALLALHLARGRLERAGVVLEPELTSRDTVCQSGGSGVHGSGQQRRRGDHALSQHDAWVDGYSLEHLVGIVFRGKRA